MKYLYAAALIGAALAGVASPAMSAVVFDNPYNNVSGDCVFNTTCGIENTGNTFAGQRFTLSASTSLTGGAFTALTSSTTQPSAVNWRLLLADGTNGLPGTLITSGNSSIGSRTTIGQQFGLNIIVMGYDRPSVTLGAGTYYIGLQGVSSDRNVFLGFASAFSGAATSNDGGVTWFDGYRTATGVAVSLSGSAAVVPEPASWAMLVAGFGLVGAVARRRRTALAA